MLPTENQLNKVLYGCLMEYIQLLPRWHSGKESACQCRRRRWHSFDPWVGKIPRRKKWHPTLVFLPGQSHVQRSLVGYSPWGCKESDTTECLSHTHTHIQLLEKKKREVSPYYFYVLISPKNILLRKARNRTVCVADYILRKGRKQSLYLYLYYSHI